MALDPEMSPAVSFSAVTSTFAPPAISTVRLVARTSGDFVMRSAAARPRRIHSSRLTSPAAPRTAVPSVDCRNIPDMGTYLIARKWTRTDRSAIVDPGGQTQFEILGK